MNSDDGRRFQDPAFAGLKVIKTPYGPWVLKCKARCNGSGERPKARVKSLADAHEWAVEHRQMHPEHDDNWRHSVVST